MEPASDLAESEPVEAELVEALCGVIPAPHRLLIAELASIEAEVEAHCEAMTWPR